MAANNQGTEEQILQWYSNLYSRRVDLVGDFAGSERFLVHGESLLLQCFSDPHIDFDPDINYCTRHTLLRSSYKASFLEPAISTLLSSTNIKIFAYPRMHHQKSAKNTCLHEQLSFVISRSIYQTLSRRLRSMPSHQYPQKRLRSTYVPQTFTSSCVMMEPRSLISVRD